MVEKKDMNRDELRITQLNNQTVVLYLLLVCEKLCFYSTFEKCKLNLVKENKILEREIFFLPPNTMLKKMSWYRYKHPECFQD